MESVELAVDWLQLADSVAGRMHDFQRNSWLRWLRWLESDSHYASRMMLAQLAPRACGNNAVHLEIVPEKAHPFDDWALAEVLRTSASYKTMRRKTNEAHVEESLCQNSFARSAAPCIPLSWPKDVYCRIFWGRLYDFKIVGTKHNSSVHVLKNLFVARISHIYSTHEKKKFRQFTWFQHFAW